MFIRPKGTDAKPRFVLVESRRIRGKKNSQQKNICSLGAYDNFEDAIKFWEIILRDLKKVLNKRDWWKRLNENPLLVKYAPKGDDAVILARLKKLRNSAARLRYHEKSKEGGKIQRNTVRGVGETSKSLKLKFKIKEISKLINKIRRDQDDKVWNSSIKSSIKNLLQDVIDFYNCL
jgi:hypothetical protein